MADDFYLRHPRMSLEERAKIFIPFEPLKGYRALLAERERRAERELEEASRACEARDLPGPGTATRRA